MIRFVDLGKQLRPYEDSKSEFAFFCTVTERFKTFGGSQTWEDAQEFAEHYDDMTEDISRYMGLIPDYFK